MKKLNMQRRRFLKGAGGAVLALPFLESLAPRRAAGQTATPPKRFIVLKTFSTQLVKEWYPAFTGNGYQLKNSKYSGSKADGTTLLTQKLVSGKNYTWAPLTDFQTSTGISGILGPARGRLADGDRPGRVRLDGGQAGTPRTHDHLVDHRRGGRLEAGAAGAADRGAGVHGSGAVLGRSSLCPGARHVPA